MTEPDPVPAGEVTTPTPPASTGAVAGAEGAEVAEGASVATRLAPLQSLLGAARAHWVMLIAAGVAGTFCAILAESFQEQKVVEAVQKWKLASRYLVNQDGSFDQALPSFVDKSLPADVWTASDRAEFEAFISNFLNEIVAVSNALDLNAEELEKARDTFHEIVTALLEVLIPVCLLVIAVIALQAFPVTAPYAEAVGFAGATITLATVALLNGQLLSALGAVITGLRGDSVTSFDKSAHAGNIPPGAADRPLRQITIDWTHDQGYYMHSGQGGQ